MSNIKKILDTDTADNSQKARKEAFCLFPDEQWREVEPHIFIAKNREPRSNNQKKILEKELIQARVLVQHGSVVYLLPESSRKNHEKHPDAIVDEYVMEFKTITGSDKQVEVRFKESRKKAQAVFFKIDGPLSKSTVLERLTQTTVKKKYRSGHVLIYFTKTKELYYWDIAWLRLRNRK